VEAAMLLTRRSLGYLALAAVLPPAVAAAEDFPTRPVQLIVPYAPGGSGDLIARLLGDKLSTLWGQQVVVQDRPGAGGLIGTEEAAHAAPDGYTLYLATDGPLTVAATLHDHVPYDWKHDLAPVSMAAVGYQVLLVDPKLPVKTLADFIALAKAKPGALNFASIGVGTAPHLAAELFLSVAGLKLTHVPYNGSSAQAIRALIAGDVAMFMVGTSTAVPFIKSGNVRALAVTSTEHRVDGLPEVPTFTEAGWPQVDYSLWFAIEAPGATPPDAINKLHAAISKVVADPSYQEALKVRGFEAKANTPEELAAFLEKDYIRNRDLIHKLGLHVD
jgi:tripartite-type tricarboxylate transporter receptor subunit TctC